ncbi:MAG: DUF2207 domain-containing protein [Proteobacteria bacterium]|nr:DUF2207 domain-containing protein [Pseudomonadota bacterium]
MSENKIMQTRKYILKTLSLVLLLLACNTPILADEVITSFDSLVRVEKTGLLTVIETISVIAEGKQIKRGIYRDFPTDYSNRAGHRVKVGFEIKGVTRDGKSEPYHTEKMSNGVRVYIGDKDIFLDSGPYIYTITYQTDRQIGFFVDYDELYWNVTGNDWAFPIDRATATIILPPGAVILQQSAYTGGQGSTKSNAEIINQSVNEIYFRTTARLRPREGFTVAVAWPKGVVTEPNMMDRVFFFLKDSLAIAVGGLGLLVLVFYYLLVWAKVGRDPEPGAIIPRYEPPAGFTPAAARYVMRMNFDHKAFTAAVVSIAVKKHLRIDDNKGTFTLTKTGGADQATLSSGEKKVVAKLFSGSTSLKLDNSNHRKISEAISALRKSIQDEFGILHFKKNSKHLLPGLVISLLIVLAIIFTAREKELAGFMSIWLSFWTLGTLFLLRQVYNAWKGVFQGVSSLGTKGGALFLTFFSLPFVGGWFVGFFALSIATTFAGVLTLVLVLSVNLLFYHLLKAPTLQGRKILDELEGLKLYLTVAEKDRLNLLNPPEQTPELFEKFLPWALALDVEQQWSEQFSTLLQQAAVDGEYSPAWYSSHRPFSSNSLVSSLGTSLSSSISSSSTAPGSSSGSSGGGSSGGGGGGGGGGGW